MEGQYTIVFVLPGMQDGGVVAVATGSRDSCKTSIDKLPVSLILILTTIWYCLSSIGPLNDIDALLFMDLISFDANATLDSLCLKGTL